MCCEPVKESMSFLFEVIRNRFSNSLNFSSYLIGSLFTIVLPLIFTSLEDSPKSRKACLMLTEFANINEGGSEALGWLNALHV